MFNKPVPVLRGGLVNLTRLHPENNMIDSLIDMPGAGETRKLKNLLKIC